MRQNPHYLSTAIAGVRYLLPFGQAIAAHRHGVSLNPIAREIWDLLQEPHSEHELIAALSDSYPISYEDFPAFAKDIHDFIATLHALGILVEDSYMDSASTDFDTVLWSTSGDDDTTSLSEPDGSMAEFHSHFQAYQCSTPVRTLSIAGLTLRLYGDPHIFSPELDRFDVSALASAAGPDMDYSSAPRSQTITAISGDCPQRPAGRTLIRHSQLCVEEYPDAFLLRFPSNSQVHSGLITRDGMQVVFFYHETDCNLLSYEFFHAMRIGFLYLAAGHGMYAIHSASLLYQGQAWLFSGPSGTGKSTHTNLWNQYYGTPILNGDLNLLAWAHGHPVICGIPWCGTSGICTTDTWPLGGIALLKQDQTNHIDPLSEDRKLLGIQQRMISPFWTKEMLQAALSHVERLLPEILVYRLRCTISREAVDVMKQAIDRDLQKPPM